MKEFTLRIGVVLFFSMVAFYTNAGAGSWTPGTDIKSLIVEGGDDDPRAVLVFSEDRKSYMPSTCESTFIEIPINTDKGKSMYSLILAAKLAGKAIVVSMPTCSLATTTRPLINKVWLN